MDIQFRGQYDRNLFFKAVRLANQPARNQQRFLVMMTIFSFAAIGVMLYRGIETGDMGGNLILLAVALVLGGIVAWIYLTPYFTARKMWANPGTRQALKGRITNRGITYILDAGINEIRWNRFTRIRKSGEMVTFIRNDGLLLVFPQHFFKKSSDWRKFLKLVEVKLIGT